LGAVCLSLAGAIIVMMPLKTIMPGKVLLVDKELATVSEMQTIEEVRVDMQDAATRKAVNDFILARESYTKDTAELSYYTAAAFMSSQLQSQWAAYWDMGNENSPFKVYKNDVKIRPEILTITPTAAPGVATARFKRWMKRADGEPVATVLNATVTYKYVNSPTEEKIRRINPFGFQITDYKTDPELGGVVEPKRAPAVATAPAAAPANDASAGLVAPQITPEVVRREAQ
jgi:type IV secretion system protein VirB8